MFRTNINASCNKNEDKYEKFNLLFYQQWLLSRHQELNFTNLHLFNLRKTGGSKDLLKSLQSKKRNLEQVICRTRDCPSFLPNSSLYNLSTRLEWRLQRALEKEHVSRVVQSNYDFKNCSYCELSLEQCSLTGGRHNSLAISAFLMVAASVT